MPLDNIDTQILALLEENAKKPVHLLAKKLAVPASTVHNRIKRMEKEKIIEGYLPRLNYKKMGKEVDVFFFIKVDKAGENNKNQETICEEIKRIPGVQEVCVITGAQDIIARAKCENIDDLHKLLNLRLRKIKGVSQTQTSIVLRSV